MVRSVMSSIIFYQPMMCASIVAFNLYSLDLNGISTNLEVFASIYEILFSATPTFAYCFLSNRVTSRLLEVDDAFYGCAWPQTSRCSFWQSFSAHSAICASVASALSSARWKAFRRKICCDYTNFPLDFICFTHFSRTNLHLFSHISILRTACSYFLLIRDVQWFNPLWARLMEHIRISHA